MENNLLTRLERAGGFGILPKSATMQERLALSCHLVALKKQGHAISADEVVEHGAESGEIRIIHYKTCVVCNHRVI